MLALKGIHSRLVFLYNQHETGGHVVLEVLLDGQWRVLDPSYNMLLRTPDGEPGTLNDVSADVALLLRHRTFLALDPGGEALALTDPLIPTASRIARR